MKEEKGQRWALRQWAHLRVAVGAAVKRKMVEMEGAEVRSVAMAVVCVEVWGFEERIAGVFVVEV